MSKFTVIIETVPHPNPQTLIDIWARIVVEELQKVEKVERKDSEGSLEDEHY